MTVESTRAQERWVENVRTVGRSKNDNSFCGLKSVHLREHLVESLFTLIVTATETSTALTANGIDFVNEDDGFAHLARLLEQIAYTACTNANKHFHEVRTGH